MAAAARSNGEKFVSSLHKKRTTWAFLRKVGIEENCSICLQKFDINEHICIMECGHMFHHSCLAPWLLSNNTCPLCRTTVYENGDDGQEEDDGQEDVKMAMFLKATDPEYLDRIYEGLHKPTKLSVVVADQPAKTIPKVIQCKTAKEIWDALETRCQGTNAMKKNRRTILTQEYEHFDSKSDESLTDLYDRFVKLLNDLSLVDKEYDIEDSNLKFLLTLPESWDLKATIIRDNYPLDETTLDKIYGMLKTYELEMDQRSKRLLDFKRSGGMTKHFYTYKIQIKAYRS
ncbi:hypothetical protein AgCh_030666 [Apium graveolens]